MADERERQRGDIPLPPNEFVWAVDETKNGAIVTSVGNIKLNISTTEQPVIFDEATKKFQVVNLDRARQLFKTAPEGWYIVLKNPAKEDRDAHPKTGAQSTLSTDMFAIGKKINIPGPCSFALWPGQMVKVVEGHRLRSNQYLVVRVYDATAAQNNFSEEIFGSKEKEPNKEKETNKESAEQPNTSFATGQLFIIRGTRVSFFIPPTGFEVVPDKSGNFIREAVTLEQLEYCILLSENGQKKYQRGPDVVFPEPTESFFQNEDGSVKFRAYELNENSGLYIKVIAEYEESESENKKVYPVGKELFITGKESMIYFPRVEHATIKYGEQEKHHATAIPAGEARYVLNRQDGSITQIKGPAMFLADPRTKVIVRRILDSKTVDLWYPGNREAIEYNKVLEALSSTQKFGDYVTDQTARSTLGTKSALASERTRSSHMADGFTRGTEYTPPRTITLNSKFDGVPSVNVWTGYAVQVVSKSKERRVVNGPTSILLEYDETLEAMELSKGTPKSDQETLRTVYLKVLGNKVSDKVTAETGDFCRVEITPSYRVNFEGDPNKWFNVENYVKFLTEHARSLIRNAVKRHGIEEFYKESINIVRDTILGPSEDGKRAGRLFEENGMRIYDVEVLEIKIGDSTINELLKNTQHQVVRETFEIAAKRRILDNTEEMEEIERKILDAKAETEVSRITRETEKLKGQLELDQAKVNKEIQIIEERLEKKLALEEGENKLHAEQLARTKKTKDQELEIENKELKQRLEELKAQSDAFKEKIEAISPALISALQVFGDKELISRLTENMAPLAMLNGNSVADSLSTLVRGTPIDALFKQILSGHTNGKTKLTE